jgi:hypothetical protein
VAGTDNKPEFRAVDVVVKDPVPPIAAPPTPTGSGKCDPPACVPDFVISGVTTMTKKAAFPDPTKLPPGADPKMAFQTENCDPELFQIVPSSTTTSKARIISVTWRKEPPPGTLSVPRDAKDEKGDDPLPAQKAPSFATLNPVTGATWRDKVRSAGNRSRCWTDNQAPSWCVPFCSFGRFVMTVKVEWQCGDIACTNDFKTPVHNIDVRRP